MGRGDKEGFHRIYSLSFWLAIVVGLICTVTSIVFAPLFANLNGGAKSGEVIAAQATLYIRAFGGVIRYEGTMALTGKEKILQLNNVGEVAKVALNGCNLGYAVGKPYGFEVSGIVREGENDIVIEVMNNLGYRERDFFSSYLPLPKSGLMGPITVQ